MKLREEKNAVGAAYYEQIEKAVAKGISQEALQSIIDAYTQLQLELQKREIEAKDIENLEELVKKLRDEVRDLNG